MYEYIWTGVKVLQCCLSTAMCVCVRAHARTQCSVSSHYRVQDPWDFIAELLGGSDLQPSLLASPWTLLVSRWQERLQMVVMSLQDTLS